MIHVDITYLLITMCTLIATCNILGRLECSYSTQIKIGQILIPIILSGIYILVKHLFKNPIHMTIGLRMN